MMVQREKGEGDWRIIATPMFRSPRFGIPVDVTERSNQDRAMSVRSLMNFGFSTTASIPPSRGVERSGRKSENRKRNTHQTIAGGQSDAGIPMALNESPIMTFAAVTLRRAANVQIPLPPLHDHRTADEVVGCRQFEVVLVTGHRHSIMNDWLVPVMMMRNVVRDQAAQLVHFARYHDLVTVQVLLQRVQSWKRARVE
jgi:hypothetical protein